MSRGRRSATIASPAPPPGPGNWWGEEAAFVSDLLTRAEAGGEQDPVSRALRVEWQVTGALADAMRRRQFDSARRLVSAWREATPEHQWELSAAEQAPIPLEDISNADLERQARVLSAWAELGLPQDSTILRRFGRAVMPQEFDRLLAEHMPGDAGERAWAAAVGENRPVTRLRADSLEQWQVAARAALRVPEAYPMDDDAEPTEGQEVVVRTPEHVAHEVLTMAMEKGWRTDLRLALVPTARGGFELTALLRVAVMTEGGPLAVSASVHLENTLATSERTLLEIARRRLTMFGWERGNAPAIERHSRAARRPLHDDELAELPERPAADILGHDTCRHEEARWDSETLQDALVLRCSACRRERIAVVPAHRLPEGHTIARNAERHEIAYLQGERARAALNGQTLREESIADLRARDGVASLDPRDYRGAGLVRTPSRTQSLRRAFSR